MAKPLLPDGLWTIIEPLLPKHTPSPKGGRPRLDDRKALTGILFVLKTGLGWEDLPAEMNCGSGMSGEVFDRRVLALHQRLHDLADRDTDDPDLRKLQKRLTPSEDLLTFVEVKGVDPTNNKAEREIRPAVLMRKSSYGSMSEPGCVTRSILMSLFRTLKQRGVDPLATTAAALRTYVKTGTLPPLPSNNSSES